MRKILLFVYVFLWCIALRGQDLVINSPDIPAYAFKVYTVDSVGLPEGGNGTDQTWDFRNFRCIDSGSTTYFEEVGENPYKTYFPDANYMIIADDNRSNISFYRRENDFIGESGTATFNKGVIFEWANKNKQDTLIDYPLYYGKKTSRKNEYDDYRYDDSTKAKIWLCVTDEIDGSGMLIAPDGHEYKALRMNTLYQKADAYKLAGNKYIFTYHQESYTTKYKWISPGLPFPFVFCIERKREMRKYPEMRKQERAETSVYYYKPFTLRVKPDFNSVKLHVTWDKRSEIQVAYVTAQQEEGVIQITDMSGKTVLRSDVASSEQIPYENKKELNTSDLIPGAYVISYVSERERGAVKWVKR